MKLAVALFAILACLFPLSARAACSNPTGSERDLIYNGDYHTYQFCNGTNWVATGSMPGGVSGKPHRPCRMVEIR